MNKFRFTVLLSASVPSDKRSKKYNENYTEIKNAQIQIEEAVISLARNIFGAGGRLVFGGHPSISPLVAMVATEFELNKDIERPDRNEPGDKHIAIFQSEAYAKQIPKETSELFNLGYSTFNWTKAIDGEEFNPQINNVPQCEKSLKFMREQMMRGAIDALVCIGGMEGVEQEFEIFREKHPGKPIFLLSSTGGASKILADKYSNEPNIRTPDNKAFEIPPYKTENKDNYEKFHIIPFTYITALIVDEIIKKTSSN